MSEIPSLALPRLLSSPAWTFQSETLYLHTPKTRRAETRGRVKKKKKKKLTEEKDLGKCFKEFVLNSLDPYQLQSRQLLGHTVDLNVALLAHIIHLLETKSHSSQMGKDCWNLGSAAALQFTFFIEPVGVIIHREGT